MENSRYVLDSNVFIEAAKQYYAFDLAPGFWESLVAYAKSGEVISIDRVKQELDRVKDGVTTWADSDFQEAFASTDETAVVQVYRMIVDWAQRQTRYSSSAKAEFAQAQVADGWLVAYAKAKGRDFAASGFTGRHLAGVRDGLVTGPSVIFVIRLHIKVEPLAVRCPSYGHSRKR